MKSNSFSGRAVPFLLQPKNKDFVQGKSPYPAIKSRFGIVMMLLLALTFLAIAGSLAYQKYQNDQLAAYGKTTTAQVVNRSSSNGYSTIYTLEYEYQASLPDQKTLIYHDSQTVNIETYNQYPEGSNVQIKYLPDNPTESQLATSDLAPNYLTGQIVAIVVPFFIALGGLLYFVWPVVIDRKLTKAGSIIKGQIVERKGESVSGKRRYYELTVKYSFVSPTDDTVLEGTQQAVRNDLKPDDTNRLRTNLPTPGATVAVLYLDNEHYKML
jgi:Protein of unknown function (DUF3592)